VWRLAWVAHLVAIAGPGQRLPDAAALLADAGPLGILPGVALAPLHWVGLDALLIYNLTLIAAFAASGVCAYVLVRELTGSTAAGVLGGVLFGFSAHRIEHFNHLELEFAFWIPLAVLAWHRAVTKGPLCGVGVLVPADPVQHLPGYFGDGLAVVTAVWFFRTPVRGPACRRGCCAADAGAAICSFPHAAGAVGDGRRASCRPTVQARRLRRHPPTACLDMTNQRLERAPSLPGFGGSFC
jgi:hypothetical protein